MSRGLNNAPLLGTAELGCQGKGGGGRDVNGRDISPNWLQSIHVVVVYVDTEQLINSHSVNAVFFPAL